MVQSFRAAVAEARRHGNLYFAGLLPEDRIEKAFGRARLFWQGWIYTPAVSKPYRETVATKSSEPHAMSIDISFLLERRIGNQWQPPLDISERFDDPRSKSGVVQVGWWGSKQPYTDIFFGDGAIVPLRRGLPEDLSPAVRAYPFMRNFGSLTYDPRIDWHPWAGWILLSDLKLDQWPDRDLYVGDQVPARHAPLFGDGRRRRGELLKLTTDIQEIEDALGWSGDRRNGPTDWTGARQWILERTPPDALVDVSWKVTLAEYVDGLWLRGLSRLVDLQPASEHRLVTCLG